MLKIKQCIDDLRISQQIVANLTGWSKAQISITFNNGEFPKDAARFKNSMRAFVEITQPITDWLAERGLMVDDLFADVPELVANKSGEVPGCGPQWACADYGQPEHDYLECRICARQFEGWLAMQRGRAALVGGAA